MVFLLTMNFTASKMRCQVIGMSIEHPESWVFRPASGKKSARSDPSTRVSKRRRWNRPV